MSDPIDAVKKGMRMQAKLQMMAYQELYNAMMMKTLKFSKQERDFITAMNLGAQEHYDNIDNLIEELLKDQAGMALMQAGMAPYLNK